VEARECLRSGDVPGAIELVKQDVRTAPRDPRLRTAAEAGEIAAMDLRRFDIPQRSVELASLDGHAAAP